MTNIEHLLNYYGLKPTRERYFSDYVKGKLDITGMDYDKFISYWWDCTPWLVSERPSGIKSKWRFDCVSLITRLYNKRFKFRAADILPCGVGGQDLIFCDDYFRAKIYNALSDKGVENVEMNGGNIDFWNGALKDGKFLMPQRIVEEILSKRGI